jgi:hypothetical protein
MLVIQHNCRRAYAITIAALEAGLERQAGIICLQEPYIEREFRHGGYLIYWPEEASIGTNGWRWQLGLTEPEGDRGAIRPIKPPLSNGTRYLGSR